MLQGNFKHQRMRLTEVAVLSRLHFQYLTKQEKHNKGAELYFLTKGDFGIIMAWFYYFQMQSHARFCMTSASKWNYRKV